MEIPIDHIILREPAFITVGDACLEAAGTKNDEIKCWWHVEYPEKIKPLTLKRLKITRRSKLSKTVNFYKSIIIC